MQFWMDRRKNMMITEKTLFYFFEKKNWYVSVATLVVDRSEKLYHLPQNNTVPQK